MKTTCEFCCLPNSTGLVFGLSQLNLDAVDAVDAVNEEDENEDEGDLLHISDHSWDLDADFVPSNHIVILLPVGFLIRT